MRISRKENILALDSEIDEIDFSEDLEAFLYFNDDLNPEKIDKINVIFHPTNVPEWHSFTKERSHKDSSLFICREHFDLGGSRPCYKSIYVIASGIKWRPNKRSDYIKEDSK
jgi:hypothetical protein